MSATIDVFSDVSKPSRSLARRDKPLAKALKAIGKPVIRRREGGVKGLFRIIVEQQVSVPSAQAIWKRCLDRIDCASPEAIAGLDVDSLKSLGLSTPKARYVSGLAAQLVAGEFEFAALAQMDDEEALARLIEIKGVGPRTAAIYLLFCDGRVDIWPPKDVALKHAYNAASGAAFDQAALDSAASAFSPWRGVAAHILWTYYAHLKGRTPI